MPGRFRPPPGSAETMVDDWTPLSLPSLVARLRLPADRPGVVAVDGRSAHGKTTLAHRLAAVVERSAIVHTDDVAWNHAILDWDGLLAEHIIGPVRRGEAVRYRPPGWIAGDRAGAVEVAARRRLLVVEGVGAARRELGGVIDASIWVQADWNSSFERGLVRDVGPTRTEAHVREFWDVWMAEELPFHEEQATWARADVVVAGQPVIPLRDDEVAVAVLPSTA